jgi:hypothetical protein
MRGIYGARDARRAQLRPRDRRSLTVCGPHVASVASVGGRGAACASGPNGTGGECHLDDGAVIRARRSCGGPPAGQLCHAAEWHSLRVPFVPDPSDPPRDASARAEAASPRSPLKKRKNRAGSATSPNAGAYEGPGLGAAAAAEAFARRRASRSVIYSLSRRRSPSSTPSSGRASSREPRPRMSRRRSVSRCERFFFTIAACAPSGSSHSFRLAPGAAEVG